MWTVVEAKAKLTEIMRRARKGEPQFIGVNDQCVVVSAEFYHEKLAQTHDGKALLATLGKARKDG